MIEAEEDAPALRYSVVAMQQSIHGQCGGACIRTVECAVRVVALLSYSSEI
jgi:hypothetical protein